MMLSFQIAIGVWLGFCFCAGSVWVFLLTLGWLDRNRGWFNRLVARWDGHRA